MDVSLRGNLVIQLANRTAAEISWVLILGICLGNLLVDPLKFFVTDDRLPPEYQFSPERNPKGHIFEYPCVVGDDLAYFAVSPGDCFEELALPVGQHDGQTVQLPGK